MCAVIPIDVINCIEITKINRRYGILSYGRLYAPLSIVGILSRYKQDYFLYIMMYNLLHLKQTETFFFALVIKPVFLEYSWNYSLSLFAEQSKWGSKGLLCVLCFSVCKYESCGYFHSCSLTHSKSWPAKPTPQVYDTHNYTLIVLQQ